MFVATSDLPVACLPPCLQVKKLPVDMALILEVLRGMVMYYNYIATVFIPRCVSGVLYKLYKLFVHENLSGLFTCVNL